MSAVLEQLAAEVATSERTLRRAIGEGTLRAERPSPQKLRMDPAERHYIRTHWPLLGDLRRALRTEPNVESAVLFGSTARGDDTPQSDVDVLVWLRAPSIRARRELRERLEQSLGRSVEVIDADQAQQNASLLEAALRDGRVLVDRSGTWQTFRSKGPALRRRVLREQRDRSEKAQQAREFFAERAGDSTDHPGAT